VRAIRQYQFGGPEVLVLDDVPDPEPAAGQVRVAVEASGVHFIDTTIRAGAQMGPYPLPDLPMTPGREIAGAVDGLGAGVDETWLGRRVVGHLGQASGGYAERAVIPVESVHELPDGVDVDAAIASAGTGRTAIITLDVAEIGSDDVVLVTAAAGGIGSLLVQAAGPHLGATVIGLAGGPEKVALVRSLGVDSVDYLIDGWTTEVADLLDSRSPTVLVDGVGGAIGTAAASLVAKGGRVVRIGYSSGSFGADSDMLAAAGLEERWVVGPKAAPLTVPVREFETRALDATANGVWTPSITEYALADAARAHRDLVERRTTGKVVLRP